MAQTQALDALIRRVPKGTKPSSKAEVIVGIDIESGEVVKGRWSLRPPVYFLVTNTTDGYKGVEDSTWVLVKDFHSELEANLLVKYQAHCESGNEETVAESLFNGIHPGAVLRENISKWVNEFAGSRPAEFLLNYLQRKADLQEHIRIRAEEDTGLTLKVKLSLEGEPPPPVIIIDPPMNFSIHVKDIDDEQDLRLKAELHIEKQYETYAILYRLEPEAFATKLMEETKAYFAQNVSLNLLYDRRNYEVIKQGLINHLDGALRKNGRKIGFLSLEYTKGKKTAYNDTVEVSLQVQGAAEPVKLINAVRMELEDFTDYKKAGSPTLYAWIRESLTDIVGKVRFEATYIGLLLEFKKLEEEIKKALSERAESIGYSIKQLITEPELEPRAWLVPFEIKTDEGEEQIFDTKYSQYQVKLDIIVTAQIKDLRSVEKYLSRRQNVPGEMKDSMLKMVSRYIRMIDPGRFYMRFYDPYEERYPNEKSVEKELSDKITKLLRKEFGAEVIDVTLRPVDTEITEHLRLLQQTICSFEIKMFMTSGSAAVPVAFTGDFRVKSVDSDDPESWDNFLQLLNYDIDKIKEQLQKGIQARLSNRAQGLRWHAGEFEAKIEELAIECIKEEFGLLIKVSNIQRQLTEIEQNWAQDEIERMIQQKAMLSDAITILRREQIDMILGSGDEDEINLRSQKMKLLEQQRDEVESRIQELNGRVVTPDKLLSSGDE